MFPDRQCVEQLGVVGNIRQRSLGGDGIMNDVVPRNREPAAGRPNDPGERAMVVVLPAPLGPTNPMTEPAATSKLNPSTATVSR